MFERYTEKARRAIFFARYEASQLGSPVIATDHLLLGILREGKELHAPLNIDAAKLGDVVRSQPMGPKTSTSVDLPLDDAAKRALAHAAVEADRMRHEHIGLEHLLLGIMLEDGRGARVLRELGAAPVDEVRKAILDAGPKEVNVPSRTKVLPWVSSMRLVDEETGLALLTRSGGQAMPRIGEAVVVERGGVTTVYRVTDVRWMFLQPIQPGDLALTTVEVRVRKETAAKK